MNPGKNQNKKKQIFTNIWNGLGTVESDFELRNTTEENNSKPVLNFNLKVKQAYKSRNPETKEQEIKHKYLLFPITLWDSVAVEFNSKIKKNDLIKVNGYIRTYYVKTRNTKNVLSFEIVCNKFASVVQRKDKKTSNSNMKQDNDRTRIKQD